MSSAEKLSAIDLTSARRLLEVGYFDAALYRQRAHLPSEADAFAHFFIEGVKTGLGPNVVFDTSWYLEQNPDVAKANVNPLLHYALVGEASGLDPSPLFDTRWYARAYETDKPLLHYLANRFGSFSPIPEFDAEYYLRTYPDVGEARIDPFLHYLHFGFREFRKPSADFNPRLYANRHLGHDRGANPIADLRKRKREGRSVETPGRGPTSFDFVRRQTRAGPLFERLESRARRRAPDTIVLAYYLTQFHRIPENDAWWGEGFTDWTQLARGQPRFAGHRQPRIPSALGFYDLSNADVMREQAKLARGAGISGFVFYYYDFDGRRLLERPLETFLGMPDLEISFCLMWANENWTRRWDGAESEVLVAQTYDERDERRRCGEFARHFRDPRYLRIDGRPLLMVYRAGLIPECARTVARWRRLCVEQFGENPLFVMAQCFDDVDPGPQGFDGAVEFPPHKLTRGLPQVYNSLDIFDETFSADVFAYDDLVEASLRGPDPKFPLIKTAVPDWDNDARRQGQGLTLVGSTPIKYERWLAELIMRAHARPALGRPIVCINAWNEWSEGAYLEPDVHFGWAYLNATARAVFGERRGTARLIFAGRGEDTPLAALARRLAASFGFEIDWSAGAAPLVGAVSAIVGPGGSGSIAEFLQAGLRTVWLFEEREDAVDADVLQRADVVVFANASAKRRTLVDAGLSDADRFVVDPSRYAGEMEDLARAMFGWAAPSIAKISVCVVARGEARHIRPSLESVFAQNYPVWEVIIADEIASEESFDAIDGCARACDRDATVVLGDRPIERALSSWRRALEMTTGEFVWIMETEAVSEPEFLDRLVAPLLEDARVALAFCESCAIGEDGKRLHEQISPLSPPAAPISFLDETFEAVDFVARFPPEASPLKSVGAILWRRDALARALSTSDNEPGLDSSAIYQAITSIPQSRIHFAADTLILMRTREPFERPPLASS